VASEVYDHASILRAIEWRWNLQPLSVRDAQANNLANALNLSDWNPDAPTIEVPGGPFGALCAAST
jgi:phospholipase C